MEITDEDIASLANASCLSLTPMEIEFFRETVKDVLLSLEPLKFDASEPDATFCHLQEISIDTCREDLPNELLPQALFLENVPEKIGSFVKVPPTLSQDN